jgi:signal transduction histidine kinase
MHPDAQREAAADEAQRALRDMRRTLDAVLEERAQLAQALHDHVIQRLYAVGLFLRTSMHDVHANPEGAAARIDATIRHINTVIGDVRSYIERMELPRLQPAHFQSALTELATTLSKTSGLPIDLHVDSRAVKHLSSRDVAHLFYITEEAVSNSLRHAQATALQVSVRLHKEHVHAEIRDDGQGFDPRAPARQRLGLRNMRARALKLGATLRVDTAPGRGTSVHLQIPLPTRRTGKPLARVAALGPGRPLPSSD